MKKFMVLYMAPMSGAAKMASSAPEEMKKTMEPWMAWYGKMGKSVVDAGAPFGETMHVGETEHPKSDVHVSGYTIIEAESADEAKKMLSDHPHLQMEHSCIEFLEIMPMPGMS